MASTEDIEARLCAYVDGELDAVERAEIERHLASNPQHRKLIEELTCQRDMLRALPRLRAPRDVGETINAQLERAALIGDDFDDDARIVRISHWAQVRAAAAVLFLVFGLAAVVYYVLPSSDPAQSEFARLSTAQPEAVAERSDDVADRLGTDFGGSVLTSRGLPDTEHRPPSAAESRSIHGLDDVLRDIAPNFIRIEGLAEALDRQDAFRAPSPANAVVRIVVDTPDPFAAQQQIERFFVSNQILHYRWTAEDAEVPEPLALAESQVGIAARTNPTRVQMHERSPADEPAAAPSLDEPLDSAATQLRQRREETQTQQSTFKYEVRGMTRKEVQAMAAELAAPAAGARAQVFEDVINGRTGMSVIHPLAPMRLPSVIDMREGAGMQFNVFPAPTTQPDLATGMPALEGPQPDPAEPVDVVVYVRCEPPIPPVAPENEAAADPSDSDHDDTPAEQPDDDAPAPEPATQPADD